MVGKGKVPGIIRWEHRMPSGSVTSWRWGGLLPAKLGLLANANVLSPLEQTVRDSEVRELLVRPRGLKKSTFAIACFRVVSRSHFLASTSSLYGRTRCKVLALFELGKGAAQQQAAQKGGGCPGTLALVRSIQDLAPCPPLEGGSWCQKTGP